MNVSRATILSILTLSFTCHLTSQQVDWVSGVRNKPFIDTRQYNWSPQSPGGSLSIGHNTITLRPGPLGLSYNDANARLYISGGTGTAESVALVTGGPGTCNGTGQSSCTVTINAANTHSNAWTAQSSFAGIYEAIIANPGRQIRIPAGAYVMHDCIALPAGPVWIQGDNYDNNGTVGTKLDFSAVTSGCNAFSSSSNPADSTYDFVNLQVFGPSSSSQIAGSGFYFNGIVRATLSHVEVSAFNYGLYTQDAFEVIVKDNSNFGYNVCWGIAMNGMSNLNLVRDTFLAFNGRVPSTGGCGGNLLIVGTSSGSPSEVVVVDRVDSEGAGDAPFTGMVAAWGLFLQNLTSVQVSNSYFESNTAVQQVLYQGGISSLTETGNFINGTGSTEGITYAADTVSVNSFSNTFYGSTSTRQFGGSFTTWNIGPDTCLNGSPECTNHPRLLATPAVAFSSLPSGLTAGQQVYCTNCTTAATCTNGGSGHMAVYNGSAWTCQ